MKPYLKIVATFLLCSELQAAPLEATPTRWFYPASIDPEKLHSDPFEDHKSIAPLALILSAEESDLIAQGTKQYHDAYKEFLKDILRQEPAEIFKLSPEGFPSESGFNWLINHELRDIGFKSIANLRELFRHHREIENTIVKVDLNLFKFAHTWMVVPMELNRFHYGDSPNERFRRAAGNSLEGLELTSNYLEYADFYKMVFDHLKARCENPVAFSWDYRTHIQTAGNKVLGKSSVNLDHLSYRLKKLKSIGFTIQDPGYLESLHALSQTSCTFPHKIHESQILEMVLDQFARDPQVIFPEIQIFNFHSLYPYIPTMIRFYLKEEPILSQVAEAPLKKRNFENTRNDPHTLLCHKNGCFKMSALNHHPILKRQMRDVEAKLDRIDTEEEQKRFATRDFFLLHRATLDYFQPNPREKFQFILGTWHASFNQQSSSSAYGKIENELQIRDGMVIKDFDTSKDLPVFIGRMPPSDQRESPLSITRPKSPTITSITEDDARNGRYPYLIQPKRDGDFDFLSDYPLLDYMRAFPGPLVYRASVLDKLTQESSKIPLTLSRFFSDIFLGDNRIVNEGVFTQDEIAHLWTHISDLGFEETKKLWKKKSLQHIFYNTALDLTQGKDGRFYLLEVNSNSSMNPGGMADHSRFHNVYMDRFGDPSRKIALEDELSATLVKSFLSAREVAADDPRAILIYDESVLGLSETKKMESLERHFQFESLERLSIHKIKAGDLDTHSKMDDFVSKGYKYIINAAVLNEASTLTLYDYFAENTDVHLMFPPGINALDNKSLLCYIERLAHFYQVEIDRDILAIPHTCLCTKRDLRRQMNEGQVIKGTKGAQGEQVLMPCSFLSEQSLYCAELFFRNMIHEESGQCGKSFCENNYAVISQSKVDAFKVRLDRTSFEVYTPILRSFPWVDGVSLTPWPYLFGRIGPTSFNDKINVHAGAMELLILSDEYLKVP